MSAFPIFSKSFKLIFVSGESIKSFGFTKKFILQLSLFISVQASHLKIELKKGDLLIFPSNFMYPHRVEPVLSGIRYSYISWVW